MPVVTTILGRHAPAFCKVIHRTMYIDLAFHFKLLNSKYMYTFLAFIMSSSSCGMESLLAELFSLDLFLVFPVLNMSFHKGERREPLVLRFIPFL